MPEIVVAIPTFRRPQGLEKLLRSLAEIDTDRDVAVIVADNDAEAREGTAVCERLESTYRWPLKVIAVPERGIAQVRNALVTEALRDPTLAYVVMLDDDQWTDPRWLTWLLRAQAETNADIVRGAVLRVFESVPPAWSTHWEGIASISASHDDTPVEGTGNVLIARRCFEALREPHFDPQFGLTGGEDRDFFVRLRRLNMKFARADKAVAYEHVPARRLGLAWSLMRAYRTGNSDMRIALKYRRGFGDIAKEFAKIAAALALAPVLMVAFSLAPTHRFDGVQKLYRTAGKIGALLGHRYYEYSGPGNR